MTQNSDDNRIWYSLRINELDLLLAAVGVRKWYGFGDTPVSRASGRTRPGGCVRKEDVNRLLAGMYRNGVILFEDDELRVSEEYKELADIIAGAETAVQADPSNGMQTLISYIASGRAAVLTTDRTDGSMVLFTIMDKDEWPSFVLRETVPQAGQVGICYPAGCAEDMILSVSRIGQASGEILDEVVFHEREPGKLAKARGILKEWAETV